MSAEDPPPDGASATISFCSCGPRRSGKSSVLGRILCDIDSNAVAPADLERVQREGCERTLWDTSPLERLRGRTIDLHVKCCAVSMRCNWTIIDVPGGKKSTWNRLAGESHAVRTLEGRGILATPLQQVWRPLTASYLFLMRLPAPSRQTWMTAPTHR